MPETQSSLYGMLEAVSKTLAPTKMEMEAFLKTELGLAREEKAPREWQAQLESALVVLEKSPSADAFLARMRPKRGMKLKNALWLIIGIPLLLALAKINDIV